MGKNPVTFVSRNSQLAELHRLLTESIRGGGRMALIEGTIGAGKTSLAYAFAASLPESTALVLHATCFAGDRDILHSVVHQLLGGLPRSGSTKGTDPCTACGASDPAPECVPSASQVGVLDVVWRAVSEQAETRPVVLILEDVHHADVESLRQLLHLVRQVRRHRVFTMLTVCPELHLARLRHQAMWGLPPHHECATVRVEPFGHDEVTDLLTGALDTVSPQVVDEFMAASGGIPRFLAALVDDQRNAADERIGAYAYALLDCLHRLGDVALVIARAVAVLEEGALSAEISRLTGMDALSVARGLMTLEATGVLKDGGLRHPAAGAVVLAELAPDEAADLHCAAARLRHEQGAAPMTVARHLVLAGRAEQWQVSILIEASEQANATGFGEPVAQILRLACDCCTVERSKAAIRARLALAEWRTNVSASARYLPELAALAGAGKLPPRETIASIRQLLWHGRFAEAGTALAVVRESAGEWQFDGVSAMCDVERWLSFAYPQLADLASHAELCTEHQGMTTPNLDPWLRATGVLSELLFRERADPTEHAVQVLRDLEVTDGSVWAEEAATLALLALAGANRVDEAADWCDRLLVLSGPHRATSRRAILLGVRAEIAVWQGDLAGARRHGRDALEHLPLGVGAGIALGAVILASTLAGDTSEAATLLARSVPDSMFRSHYGLHYLYARGRYYLATNHARAALADFMSCGEITGTWAIDNPTLVPWRVGAAEAWLRLRNPDRARSILYDQLAKLRGRGRARAMALRVLAATSTVNRRQQLLTEAAEVAELSGDPLEQARALGELSQAFEADGDGQRARMLLRRALHLARTCGARPLTQELLSAAGEVGVSQPRTVSNGRLTMLTNSEQRVASLAAMGYTNREIAGRLYVTSSTVEQHLTKVYRKLAVRSRQDLPMGLWRTPASEAESQKVSTP